MRKTVTTTIALLLATWATGQNPTASRPYKQITRSYSFDNWEARTQFAERPLLQAPTLPQGQTFSATGKTSLVSPVTIGQAANVFTCVTTSQNQVWADDALDMVAFIHRNDNGIWGGSSGHLRYDLSTDGGGTFTNDIGPINPALTRVARYPNMTGHNPTGSSNAFNTHLVYSASVLDPNASFDGHVVGRSTVTTSAPISTENYLNVGQGSYLPSGLCQGTPGTFWSVDREYLSAAFTGRFFINKGTYNTTTQDVDWVRQDTITPPHYTVLRPTGTISNPNISFSSDGQTGWIAWLGDLVGGADSVLSPVFMKSTDGGATWGAPMQVDLLDTPWVDDTLKSLWTDSLNNPLSSGKATCGFDFDLIVDGNGNPHFAVVVGSGSATTSAPPEYSIYPDLAMFLGDIWTPDGGTTWIVNYISPVLAFSGEFGQGANGTVRMDNNVQVSRNPAGDEIYFSWVDSDTLQTGFGISDMLAPNLRIAGFRPYEAAGTQTYPKLVTDGDIVWEGRALWPTMAPVTLTNGACSQLPIVMVELLNNDGYSAVQFYYFGNDAEFCDADFCDYATMTLGWTAFATPGFTPVCHTSRAEPTPTALLKPIFPNPTQDAAIVLFELESPEKVRVVLRNLYGQEIATLAAAEFSPGAQRLDIDTRTLASGIYFITLYAGGQSQTQKMVISR
jgi:hypothetical protein